MQLKIISNCGLSNDLVFVVIIGLGLDEIKVGSRGDKGSEEVSNSVVDVIVIVGSDEEEEDDDLFFRCFRLFSFLILLRVLEVMI